MRSTWLNKGLKIRKTCCCYRDTARLWWVEEEKNYTFSTTADKYERWRTHNIEKPWKIQLRKCEGQKHPHTKDTHSVGRSSLCCSILRWLQKRTMTHQRVSVGVWGCMPSLWVKPHITHKLCCFKARLCVCALARALQPQTLLFWLQQHHHQANDKTTRHLSLWETFCNTTQHCDNWPLRHNQCVQLWQRQKNKRK